MAAKRSTKQLAVRGVAFNGVARVVSIVIVFFLTPFLIRTMGVELYGLWTVVMGLTNYYALADMGLRGAGTKYIAQYAAADDREALSRVIVTCLGVYSLLALIPLVSAALLAAGFPYLFQPVLADVQGKIDLPTIRAVILITGVVLSVRVVGQVFGAALVGQTRFDESSSLGMAHELTQAVLWVYVLRAGYGLLGVALVMLGMTLATQTVQAGLALRSLPDLSLSPSKFDRPMLHRLFSFSMFNLLVNGSHRLHTYAGSLVVAMFAGALPVASYSIAESLMRHAQAFTKTITNVVLPVASRFQSQQRRDDLQQLLVMAPRALLSLTVLIAIVVAAWGDDLIRLWLGKPDLAVQTYPVLVLLSAAGVFSLTAQGFISMMLGMGNVRTMSLLAVFDALVMLAVGTPLAWFYGATGMAAGVLATHLLCSGVLIPHFTAKSVKCSYGWLLAQTLPLPVLANLPSAGLAWLIATYSPTKNLPLLVLQALSVALISGACSFFICLSPRMRTTVLASVGIRWPLGTRPVNSVE